MREPIDYEKSCSHVIALFNCFVFKLEVFQTRVKQDKKDLERMEVRGFDQAKTLRTP